jgi:hypothetical protein
MSDSRPTVSSNAEATTRYPMMTHSMVPLKGVLKARAIVGSPMLTIEASSVVMKRPVQTSASTASG